MENIEIWNVAYWQKWAQEVLEGTIKKIETGAEKLEKLVGTLWLSYTTLYGVGGMFVFDFTQYETVSVVAVCLLAAPILSLMLSYWFCCRAELPVSISLTDYADMKNI